MRCWPLPFFLLTRASLLAFLTRLVANVGGPTPVPLRSGNVFPHPPAPLCLLPSDTREDGDGVSEEGGCGHTRALHAEGQVARARGGGRLALLSWSASWHPGLKPGPIPAGLSLAPHSTRSRGCCFLRLNFRPRRIPWPVSHFCSIMVPCLLHGDPVVKSRFWGGSPLSSHQHGSAVSQHPPGPVLCLVQEAGLSNTRAAQEMTLVLLHLRILGFWGPLKKALLRLLLSKRGPESFAKASPGFKVAASHWQA